MLRKYAEWTRWPRVAVAAAAILIVVVNEVGYQRARDATQLMAIEQSRRGALHAIFHQLDAVEAAQSALALSQSVPDLAVYQARVKELGANAVRLSALFAGDENILPTSQLIAEKLAVIALRVSGAPVQSKQDGANPRPWPYAATDVTSEDVQALRTAAQQMRAATDDRIAALHARIDRSFLQFRSGAMLAVCFGLLGFLLLFRQADRHDRRAKLERDRLAAERVELEALVLARTTRLSVLANHLQRVQENERENLARELHDELGALLTTAKLDVARVKSKLADGNEASRLRLAHLSETLDAIITLKREIIENLRPSTLSNLGLVASLEILTREFGANTGIAISSRLEPVEMDGDAQLTLYRVVQESLTNIVRYAKARHVYATLERQAENVVLTIEDDGVGFDFALHGEKSHGIAGMRHRVESLGGEFSIDATPGRGVLVRAVLPHRR